MPQQAAIHALDELFGQIINPIDESVSPIKGLYLCGEVRRWIKARVTEDGIGDNQAKSSGERIVKYAGTDNAVRQIVSLIDKLYDQNVKLYLSSDVPLAELYNEGALVFEFRRIYSRLMEMSQGKRAC